ncbi:putative viral membrane protein [Alphaentomopoxvirus acuprea]|uniref:Putative viral membrane protein n=1 Tax=Alphaentomopoxvirus acuprea TaxID=62099 RepID=W6JIW3_9POXV|nr:putative viral membrane protein [Anomala cuprea entomopoxvirus]BAO49538.1 putative viral membrane protein [Anomala cuprea entomopoxvirus]
MNNTLIEIGEKNIDYYRSSSIKFKEYKGYIIYLLSIIFIILSTIFFALQCFKWEPLIQLEIFRRIKKNIGSWQQLIIEKTSNEITRGKARALQLSPNAFSFACYDFGSHYSAIKLNQNTFLPEFILRGTGDVWRFNKAATIDPGAQQFCQFIILSGNNNSVSCGIEMFNLLGYSGFFENNHPCNNALDLIVSQNRLVNSFI